MELQLQAVRTFMEKYGLPLGPQSLETVPDADDILQEAAGYVQLAADLLHSSNVGVDLRESRGHHLAEELAEYLQACANGDAIETFDALLDMQYLLLGAFVVFDLPLEAGFGEVHMSNMTKSIDQERPGHPLKGEDYVAPRLEEVLEHWSKSGVRPIYVTGQLNQAADHLDVRGLSIEEREILRKYAAQRIRSEDIHECITQLSLSLTAYADGPAH